ncbi:hypothetical protein BKG59_05545 [Mycobacteroides chelonae]|nr:hypothetical protein BKG63_24165 [Mycobacteroides chelonae]OHT99567.1 hypothetical protein BKG72_03835 [Mycobacteroides chelonae]OLT92900.1 hypothetical protein BKG59_05545 [Mycobacteroides chelonae]
MANDHFLTDVNVYKPNKALAAVMSGAEGGLEGFLLVQAEKVKLAYQAKVAKKTGHLAESATASVEVGGHNEDRLVGKVTVGPVENKGFFYGNLHEYGSKSQAEEYPGARDLREVMHELYGGER